MAYRRTSDGRKGRYFACSPRASDRTSSKTGRTNFQVECDDSLRPQMNLKYFSRPSIRVHSYTHDTHTNLPGFPPVSVYTCVWEKLRRAYLVGGSGPTTNDPDIALGCLCWSWSSPCGPEAPTSSSIFVFGGEASCPSAAACSGGDESAPAEHPTLADVYEASPKGTSGILVWRALTPAGVRCPGGLKDTTESDPVRDTPAPVAFPASCAASVRGSCEAENGGGNSDGIEEALLVHGGRDQRSELLADLWAFFPSRLSKCLLQVGGEGGQEGNEDGCGTATGWQRLNPQGEG